VIQFESTLIVASVAGTLAVVVAFIVRGRESGWELSSAAAVTLYVRIASLAGTVVSAIGLAELLRAWLISFPAAGGSDGGLRTADGPGRPRRHAPDRRRRFLDGPLLPPAASVPRQ